MSERAADPGVDPGVDPSAMRRDYVRDHLDESSVPAHWLALFRDWFVLAAAERGILEANAMQLATVDEHGRPALRTVLMKGFDEDGITFYTNYFSAKARDLDARHHAAAVFAWLAEERQVRITGPVHRVSAEESAAYFATRPRGAQLGAWASHQSRVIGSRAELEAALARVSARFAGADVPAPEHWGGYRIVPDAVEFWQGRPDRLHDRLRYRRDGSTWLIERLAP
jgi:pyridoxamine 5'-phosphate oxidase